MTAPTIAVILPAFDEAKRIEQTLDTVARYVQGHPNIRSVTVADDGSRDGTAEVVRAASRRVGLDVEILEYPHRGKAATIRDAMLDLATRSDATYLMMLDADDELRIDQLDRVAWQSDARTIYIGRRVGAVGDDIAVRPPVMRRAMSLAMRLASRILLGIRYPDTQCGFKLFPRSVASGLFSQQRSKTWTFDAEILYVAGRLSRLPIVEVPVVWSPRGVSRVRPLSAAVSGLSMFVTAAGRARRVYRAVGPDVEPAIRIGTGQLTGGTPSTRRWP